MNWGTRMPVGSLGVIIGDWILAIGLWVMRDVLIWYILFGDEHF